MICLTPPLLTCHLLLGCQISVDGNGNGEGPYLARSASFLTAPEDAIPEGVTEAHASARDGISSPGTEASGRPCPFAIPSIAMAPRARDG